MEFFVKIIKIKSNKRIREKKKETECNTIVAADFLGALL
jgi:hypothetical protein